MFCNYCGTQNPDDAVFCHKCGRRQKEVSDQPVAEVTLVPFPLLAEASTGSGQPPVGNVPTVQGAPTILDSSSGQSFAQDAANAASSALPSSVPSRAASKGSQAPSLFSEQQIHSSGPQTFSQREPQTHPAHTGLLTSPHIEASSAPASSPPSVGRRVSSGGLKLTGSLSRRVLIVGLVVVMIVAVAGGSVAWLALSQNHQAAPSSSSLPPVTPKPPPLGTTFLVHYGKFKRIDIVAWSPDGNYVASKEGRETSAQKFETAVSVWDAKTGKIINTNALSEVWSIVWSPDGKRIATGGVTENGEAFIQVRDAMTGGNVSSFIIDADYYTTTSSLAWSPEGKFIAAGCDDGRVRILDAARGNTILTYSGNVSSSRNTNNTVVVAWSPDGKYIASGSGGGSSDSPVLVWDAVTGNTIYSYHGYQTNQDASSNLGVYALAWSPDGKRIASAGGNQEESLTIQVWDAFSGGNAFVYRGHTNYAWAVAWSPGGKRIASGSADNTVQVWDADTGRNVFTYQGHTEPVYSIAWSPDGMRIVSASYDNTARVWQAV